MKDSILQIVSVFILPYIQIFGLYLILYGHVSPGGGFAGGAILGVGFLLVGLAFGGVRAAKFLPHRISALLESGGGIWYLLVGFIPLFLGYNYLENFGSGSIWDQTTVACGRMILLLSLGIGLKVASTMFTLFQELAGSGDENGNTDYCD